MVRYRRSVRTVGGSENLGAPNPYTIQGGVVHMELSGGDILKFDEEDLPLMLQYHWNALASRYTHYARAKRKGKSIAAHRLILGLPDGGVVDHINGDGLDNRRKNLRLTDHSSNQFNRVHAQKTPTSRLPGVSKIYRQGGSIAWTASIRHEGHRIHLGTFDREEDAARSYQFARRRVAQGLPPNPPSRKRPRERKWDWELNFRKTQDKRA